MRCRGNHGRPTIELLSFKLLQAGRFIVQSAGVRNSGLAAHEVLEFVRISPSADTEIFLINRVDDDGRLELRGVDPSRIEDEEHIIVRFDDVRLARQQFEEMQKAGLVSPPPCNIRLELARVPPWDSAPVIAAIIPAPCMNAVATWIRETLKGSLAVYTVQSDSSTTRVYCESSTQILETDQLKTRESQPG